jgi:geranylgeranyl diphosphate synthase type I
VARRRPTSSSRGSTGGLAGAARTAATARASPSSWATCNDLRLELNVGQYLDLLATARADRDRALAHRIARYKSGKYTIERPLHVGAALAGRLGDLRGPLSANGDPLGEAFQLRDDVLGAFGDPAVTGKPVGQDLREGKPTPLLAAAVERASDGHNDLLDRVGQPGLSDAEVLAIQQLLVDGGALDEIERLIERLTARAIDTISTADITPRARDELVDLARFVASRDA